MKIKFLYHPVSNMSEALEFYTNILGFKELWKVEDATVGLEMPGSDVQLLLNLDDSGTPGGQFAVEDLEKFYLLNKDRINFITEPVDINPGKMALIEDPSGNVIRVMDFSKVQNR